jgi:TBC1 domain family protein 5
MLERGEKLGINQAVREAMGELRKNMQSFNEARSNDGSKFAADEVAATALAAMERRNKQLASFLDQTVTDLKTLSASNLEDKAKSLELIEAAAAKVQFVQVHLVDASMNLPEMSGSSADDSATSQRNNEEPKQKLEESKPTTQTSAPKQTSAPEQTSGPKAAKQPEVLPDDIPVSSLKVSDSKPPAKQQESSALPPKAAPTAEPGADVVRTSADKAPAQTQSQPEAQVPAENTEDPTQSAQPAPSAETKKPQSAPPPKPAIPRATIAQSSFSWMLEPDESTPSKARASPQSPADKSPSMGPNQHRKKASNNVKRERNAFLFGEVEGDGESDSLKSDQIFGLESMHKDKGVFDS